jgi:hypothetical protein
MPLSKKCRTQNRYRPWFTPDLTALDQHKNTCTAPASYSPHNMQHFREVRNQYTQSIRKALGHHDVLVSVGHEQPKGFLVGILD